MYLLPLTSIELEVAVAELYPKSSELNPVVIVIVPAPSDVVAS